MSETNFNIQPDFDGFLGEFLDADTGLPVDLLGAKDSTQYDFTVAEAAEMREQTAVEQQQRDRERKVTTGSATLDLAAR
jgi:hypothetical protein